MMTKKSWLILIAFLVSLSVVKAELEINTIPVKDTVLPGQNAEFLLSIKSDINQVISLSYSDDFWRAKIEPTSLSLQANFAYDNIKINMYPLGSARPGNYVFKLRIVDAQINEIIQEYPINVVLADREKAIDVEVLTSALDPSLKENLLQLKFTNNYNIDMENVKVSIDSELFTHDFILNLKPKESKIEDIIVKLDSNVREGNYVMNVGFKINEIQLATIKESFTVSNLKDVKKTIDFIGGLLTGVKQVTIVNEGNSIVKETYSESVSLIQDIFTSTNIDPNNIIKKDEGRILVWEFNLQPGESRIIRITTGYRMFVLLLITLLVIIGLWYFLFGKDVSITKKVVTVSGEKDAFGRIKVSLAIRNRGKHTMHNLRVLDRIPGFVKPVKEEFSGIHPISIKRYGNETIMIWNISNIERNSEHTIHYTIGTKLHIFGKVSLPAASVRYKNERGRIVTSSSNKLMLFSLPAGDN